MRRNLKKKLREFYQETPPMPDFNRKDELAEWARGKKISLPLEDSVLWFIRKQIVFVSRNMLLFQFILIALYWFFTITVRRENDAFQLLALFSPLAVLPGVLELSRSYRYGMTELELPSRFSLPQILLARIVIGAVLDLASLACMLAMAALRSNCTVGALILYGFVPGILTASGSMFLFNRCRSRNVGYAISAYCISLSGIGAASLNIWPEWHNRAAVSVWMAVLAGSAVFLAEELYKMFHDCTDRLECVKS